MGKYEGVASRNAFLIIFIYIKGSSRGHTQKTKGNENPQNYGSLQTEKWYLKNFKRLFKPNSFCRLLGRIRRGEWCFYLLFFLSSHCRLGDSREDSCPSRSSPHPNVHGETLHGKLSQQRPEEDSLYLPLSLSPESTHAAGDSQVSFQHVSLSSNAIRLCICVPPRSTFMLRLPIQLRCICWL